MSISICAKAAPAIAVNVMPSINGSIPAAMNFGIAATDAVYKTVFMINATATYALPFGHSKIRPVINRTMEFPKPKIINTGISTAGL